MVASLDDPSEIHRLSLEALELAARHATPPSPAIYEIWFTYASGENQALNLQVDEAVAADGALSAAVLRRIHDTFFSALQLRRAVSNISTELDEQLDASIDLVTKSADSGQDYAASLRTLSKKVSQQGGADKVAVLAERMIALNQDHLDQNLSVAAELAAVKESIKSLQDELREIQAFVHLDHLTQLSNRRHFDQMIEREVTRAHEVRAPLSLIVADIDRFKAINDSYGHALGDKVIVKIAEVFRMSVRKRDVAARLGGEEFGLILPNTTLEGAAALAERLREYCSGIRISDPSSRQRLRRITVSFGVVELRDGEEPSELLRRADKLLYAAKREGRDLVKSSEGNAPSADASTPSA